MSQLIRTVRVAVKSKGLNTSGLIHSLTKKWNQMKQTIRSYWTCSGRQESACMTVKTKLMDWWDFLGNQSWALHMTTECSSVCCVLFTTYSFDTCMIIVTCGGICCYCNTIECMYAYAELCNYHFLY